MTRLVALCFAALLLFGACGGDGGGNRRVDSGTGEPAPEGIDGVLAYGVTDNTHVEGTIDYDVSPPVGGPHNPVWANCGFYDGEIPNENAVHSLEHGAVWVTYDPEALSDEDVAALRSALPATYVILSPFEGLPSPIVLSGWNSQLEVDEADDPRIAEFLEEYWLSQDVPEPGASCTGAIDGPGKVS